MGSVPQKRGLEGSWACGRRVTSAIREPGSRPSPDAGSASALILDSQPPEGSVALQPPAVEFRHSRLSGVRQMRALCGKDGSEFTWHLVRVAPPPLAEAWGEEPSGAVDSMPIPAPGIPEAQPAAAPDVLSQPLRSSSELGGRPAQSPRESWGQAPSLGPGSQGTLSPLEGSEGSFIWNPSRVHVRTALLFQQTVNLEVSPLELPWESRGSLAAG